MQMSSRENPSLPCDAEKVGLDFNEIVREIVEEQEDIKTFTSEETESDIVFDNHVESRMRRFFEESDYSFD